MCGMLYTGSTRCGGEDPRRLPFVLRSQRSPHFHPHQFSQGTARLSDRPGGRQRGRPRRGRAPFGERRRVRNLAQEDPRAGRRPGRPARGQERPPPVPRVLREGAHQTDARRLHVPTWHERWRFWGTRAYDCCHVRGWRKDDDIRQIL